MGSLYSKGTHDDVKATKRQQATTSAASSAPASASRAPAASTSSEQAGSSKKHALEENKKHKQDGADEHRLTLEEATADTDELYKKHRAAADEHAKLRAQYFEEASEAHKAGDGKRAKELSDKGKEEGRLMEEASMKAARTIFGAKNKRQPDGTIDLHGLQVKEAELIVAEELEKAKKRGAAELRIIIGAGHHSAAKGPKVGPAIKKMLTDNGTIWHEDETNTSGGSIIATF